MLWGKKEWFQNNDAAPVTRRRFRQMFGKETSRGRGEALSMPGEKNHVGTQRNLGGRRKKYWTAPRWEEGSA